MTRNFDRRGGPLRRVAMVLAAVLTLNPGLALAGAGASNEAGAAAVPGALVIQSEPAGANVYVDGRLAGHTPLQVGSLTAGDHRVRVVKDGYLENARIVSVGATPKNIHVKLTPHTGPRNASAEQVTGGGGGGSNKWLWIGLAGGGAAAAAFVLLTRNKAPVAGSISSTPSPGIVGTNVAFSVTGASDPDGDALTYEWNFGDGLTASGAQTNHTFAAAGTFNVTVVVSDGDKSATATTTVTIRNLTGAWRGTLVTLSTLVNLTQTNASLSGSYSDQILGAGSVTGSINATTRVVTFTVSVPGFLPFIFTGNPNSEVTTLTGTVSGSGFVNTPWTMTR